MSLLDRVRECNEHDLSGFRPFLAGGDRIGWVRHRFAGRLERFGEVFRVSADAVRMADGLDGPEARSAAMERVLRELADEGVVRGWRGETYPVATAFGLAPVFSMERAGVPHFGVTAYGVHLNGYVRRRDGLHMWIGRRAKHKPTYPDRLDNMVAGGQPAGLSLMENLVKECAEEASLPEGIARMARPVGAVSYVKEVEEGLKPDVQFCFDLELPEDFTPRPNDDEIAEFYLWPIEEVARVVAETTEFKFNCNLVIIDFLVRHGLVPPDDPDYLAILRGLHR